MEFTTTKKDGTRISFVDKKRWLWFSSTIPPLVCLGAYGLYFFAGNNPIFLIIPFCFLFLFLPLLDLIVGHDPNNPPEEIVPAMSQDKFYDTIAYMVIPFHYVSFLACVWLIASQQPPLGAVLFLVVGVGSINGNLINLGHELGHKNDRTNRFFAKFAFCLSGYGHFTIEHNRGHHVKVSTPDDCASARMGESIYAFALRELPGAFIGGWRHETKRLANNGLPRLHWQNEILQVYAVTALISIGLVIWLGWLVLPFIIGHHFFSWYALTQVNYIEHYGLLRQKRANGKYEPCAPRHSWNSNHKASNLMLFQLQRHSDHHAHPARPYQALRNFDDLPSLPSGYPGCLGLSAFPWIWFKVMDPKILAWANGDYKNINMCPRHKDFCHPI